MIRLSALHRPAAAIVLVGAVAVTAHAATVRARAGHPAPRLVVVVSRPTSRLAPGVVAREPVAIVNHAAVAARLVKVSATVVGTSRARCRPGPSSLAVSVAVPRTAVIKPRATLRLTARLRMPLAVADACQGASFSIQYSAQAAAA